MKLTAIQTRYKGYFFRSRLEARWAAFFNELSLDWEYEPEGFELPDGSRYLPDFRVTYPGPYADTRHQEWFEVKPDMALITQDEWRRMLAFGNGLILLDGVPDVKLYNTVHGCLELDDREQVILPYKVRTELLKADRLGDSIWSPKRRIWVTTSPEELDEYCNGDYTISKAVYAARSERFERAGSQ